MRGHANVMWSSLIFGSPDSLRLHTEENVRQLATELSTIPHLREVIHPVTVESMPSYLPVGQMMSINRTK